MRTLVSVLAIAATLVSPSRSYAAETPSAGVAPWSLDSVAMRTEGGVYGRFAGYEVGAWRLEGFGPAPVPARLSLRVVPAGFSIGPALRGSISFAPSGEVTGAAGVLGVDMLTARGVRASVGVVGEVGRDSWNVGPWLGAGLALTPSLQVGIGGNPACQVTRQVCAGVTARFEF